MMTLTDGLLKFELRGDGEPIQCSIDLMMLSLACNEVLQVHRLPEWVDPRTDQPVPDTMMPTTDFLAALTEKLSPLWETSRPVKMTPTIARALWLESGNVVSAEKKNTASTPTSPGTTESTPSGQPTATGPADSPTGAQNQDSAGTMQPGCC